MKFMIITSESISKKIVFFTQTQGKVKSFVVMLWHKFLVQGEDKTQSKILPKLHPLQSFNIARIVLMKKRKKQRWKEFYGLSTNTILWFVNHRDKQTENFSYTSKEKDMQTNTYCQMKNLSGLLNLLDPGALLPACNPKFRHWGSPSVCGLQA